MELTGCPGKGGGAVGALDARLSRARPGEVIDLGPLAPAALEKVSATSGQLFYSNNPEPIPAVFDTALTLLCRNAVAPGETRCFVYHVNGAGRPSRVTVILEPLTAPARVTVRQRALAAPARDYTGIGRQVQHGWFQSRERIELPVFGPTLLDGALDQWAGGEGDLFHAMWTWEADQPLLVTVAALPAGRRSLDLAGAYALVPREGVFSACPEDFRARGVFQATKWVAAPYDTRLGERFVPVGHPFCAGRPTVDGPTFDAWVSGWDATPRAPGDTARLGAYLPGNFGVLYRLWLPLTGDQQVAVLLNPRGGSIQGAFRAAPGLTPGGVIPYGPVASRDQAVLVARYDPPAAPEVHLMPGGAASLPWRVLLIPYRQH